MYIAKKHIGNKYMPGDTIPDNLPADMVEWLIRADAIREAAPAPSMPDTIEGDSIDEDEQARAATRENYARQLAGMGYDPSGNPLPTDSPDDEAPVEGQQDAEGGDVEDEIDEDAEAPEIDVMAGIVKDETKAEKKSASKSSSAGKKAPKGGKAK